LPGAKAPKLIKRSMLKLMKPGSVFVDIAIDQGGCAETSHPTTHENPIYVKEGVVHYCVTNMPGAYARTSTQALTQATFRYAFKIAQLGLEKALLELPELNKGVNTYNGQITCQAVADSHTWACGELKAA
jgi:alanine dehydrogenase